MASSFLRREVAVMAVAMVRADVMATVDAAMEKVMSAIAAKKATSATVVRKATSAVAARTDNV